MIYIPFGVSAPQILDMDSDVTYEAFYISPLNGMEHDLGVVEPTSGTWQAPSTPSSDLDWILVLEKQCSPDWFPVIEMDFNWVYHDVHGFNWVEYPSSICPEYAYIWNVNLGEWLFISADHKNFIYRAEKDTWLYYGTGTAFGYGRWFYDYNQSQWVHESAL